MMMSKASTVAKRRAVNHSSRGAGYFGCGWPDELFGMGTTRELFAANYYGPEARVRRTGKNLECPGPPRFQPEPNRFASSRGQALHPRHQPDELKNSFPAVPRASCYRRGREYGTGPARDRASFLSSLESLRGRCADAALARQPRVSGHRSSCWTAASQTRL